MPEATPTCKLKSIESDTPWPQYRCTVCGGRYEVRTPLPHAFRCRPRTRPLISVVCVGIGLPDHLDCEVAFPV